MHWTASSSDDLGISRSVEHESTTHADADEHLAHVGNFPGITVDILTADVRLAGGAVVTIADLPGLLGIP